MWIKDEVTTGYELEQKLWGQAKNTWQKIFNAGKEEQALQYFEEMYGYDGEPIDITSINDELAYDDEHIMEYLGLNDLKEEYITVNEMDVNMLLVDSDDLKEYLLKEVNNSNSGVITTDLYAIEEEIGRELTDDEVEELIRVGQ